MENTGLGYKRTEDGGQNFHPTTQGRWVMGESIDRNLMVADPDLAWFDSTDELAKRYIRDLTAVTNPGTLAAGGVQYLWKDGEGSYTPAGGGTAVTTVQNLVYAHTYTWDRETLGGRFASNHMGWWTYGVKDFTLTLGADEGGPTKVVTETSANLPWETAMSGYSNYIAYLYTTCWAQDHSHYCYHTEIQTGEDNPGHEIFYGWATNLTLNDILNVRHVKTKGGLAPTDPGSSPDPFCRGGSSPSSTRRSSAG